jgi:hypothetical protein
MSMKSLREEPFFLPVSEEIVVRVSAINSKGTSITSLNSRSSIKVIKPLDKMDAPTLKRIDYESMQVSWVAPKSAESYSLFWDKGDSTSKVDKVVLGDTTTLTHTVAGFDPAKDYRFAIRG